MTTPMPAIFIGHGNPMNALQHNQWTEAWSTLGQTLPRPRAILCISAHWYLPATLVTAMNAPRTIHDFGGFPRELYEVKYPAPGDVELARRVQELFPVEPDNLWGLDHGTWSVLMHVYPEADTCHCFTYSVQSIRTKRSRFRSKVLTGGSISMLAVRAG